MMFESMCLICKHFLGTEGKGCAAFPDGIPPPILRNEADHRQPYEGDGGIRFERIEPKDEKQAAWVEYVESVTLLSDDAEGGTRHGEPT